MILLAGTVIAAALLGLGSTGRPSRAQEPTEAAVDDVAARAAALVDVSGCPLSFEGASFTTTVTAANRDAIVEDIVQTTAVVIASDFECTGVMTLQEGLDGDLLTPADVEAYHAFVDGLVAVDDVVVAANWMRTSDNLALFTKAVVDDTSAQLIYDPMITSWNNAGPYPGTPNPPSSGSTTWTWRPWDPGGATIAEMIFGKDTVWKNPVMVVTFDDEGNVVAQDEDPQVNTFIDSAVVSQKTQIIGNCKRWSFRVHWKTPTATMKIKAGTQGFSFDIEFGGIGSSGTDLEIYELCWDGSSKVLEGPPGYTPPTPIGGIAELPDVAQPSLETAASSSGSSSPPYAAIAGAAAAVALALTAGAWYARRRLS